MTQSSKFFPSPLRWFCDPRELVKAIGLGIQNLESTRIRIFLIDRLLDFELVSGRVRLDVPAKSYDNVE